jgi:hypothetical protein
MMNFFKELLRNKVKWKEIEYFDQSWRIRIQQMAKYIPENSKIMDLGCGEMWTKDFLPLGCIYYPVDYIDRGMDTIVCDFNKKQFPNLKADISFVSGCLEYVKNYRWFIKSISESSQECILSYCTLDKFPEIDKRKARAWVNNLSREELIKVFENNGLFVVNEEITQTQNSIFYFKKRR